MNRPKGNDVPKCALKNYVFECICVEGKNAICEYSEGLRDF